MGLTCVMYDDISLIFGGLPLFLTLVFVLRTSLIFGITVDRDGDKVWPILALRWIISVVGTLVIFSSLYSYDVPLLETTVVVTGVG